MNIRSDSMAAVVGGGAAGFFGAIACAEAAPNARVIIFEKSPEFLTKVRISGGGRCNVTHHCFDPRQLATRYPRGEHPLIGPFNVFQPRDTIQWFEARGVKLKTEADGRMFPITDSSQTVIDCLMREASARHIEFRARTAVEGIRRFDDRFELQLGDGKVEQAATVLLATGGCRVPAMAALAASLGHSIESPAPSLFSFHINAPWLRELSGVSAEIEASVPSTKLRERGPALITHWGMSGPAILRLSAWGARELQRMDYKFKLIVNWLPEQTEASLLAEFEHRARTSPAKILANAPILPLTARLWRALLESSGISPDTRWASFGKAQQRHLIGHLTRMELPVSGKSLNKDEFVTCGGVKLTEVNFKTMESKLVPGLHFAGELLDIDGITGGFNFQAAWTTGYIAGKAMAVRLQG